MPLAYPSTLDRAGGTQLVCRSSSYVEGRWSPSLAISGRIAGESTRVFLRAIHPRRGESFSLRRGLDVELRFVQAEHHLSSIHNDSSPETTKATSRSPSLESAMRLLV